MANPEHIVILKQGVKVWNKWRKENREIRPDLVEADLRRSDLSNINLTKADLTSAVISEAVLRRADFKFANLSNANLKGADLSVANFRKAVLRGASLMESDLRWVDFSGAILQNTNFDRSNLRGVSFKGTDVKGANFSDSIVIFTLFSEVDLSGAIRLDNVNLAGPSSIGIDTIYKSKGQIPEIFLRGCGLSDLDIEYTKLHRPNLSNREIEDITYRIAHLRLQGPLQFYSCFISHSTNDAEFAGQLYSALQKTGVRCWYAPEDMKGGKKIYPQIDEAIKVHDKLILILSESSINSPWVATEIKRTRKYEKQEGGQRLFPISLLPFKELRDWELFDADSGTDLAAEVRSYFIPDFSNWKNHDRYKKAFERLLSDLKATE